MGMHREAPQWSASLPQRLSNAPQRTPVCCSAFGILAELIWMPFGMVVGVGPGTDWRV